MGQEFPGWQSYKMENPTSIINNAFGKYAKFLKFRKGDFIYQDGEPAGDVFGVAKGRVKLSKGMNGASREFIHHVVCPGEFFGMGEMIANKRERQTAAVAIDKEVIVWRVPFFNFFLELKSNRRLSNYFIDQLMKRENRAWKRYMYSRKYLAHEVVIVMLVDMATERGVLKNKGVAIQGFTHRDLAEYIGTSRQTVTQVLNLLRDENKIEYSRNEIIIKVKPLSHETMLQRSIWTQP